MPDASFRPAAGRLHPEHVFRPRSVAVIGSVTVAGAEVLGNLRAGGFRGTILTAETAAEIAAFAAAPDLAVLCGPDIADTLAALGRSGTRAAVVVSMSDDLATPAQAAGVRVFGPGSFGIAVPAIGLHAIRSHLRPRLGRAALVSQSAALCRAVIDWAEPNGVGFSHIVGVGGNHDLGFAMVLDWLSRDPDTGAILLDLRRIRDTRRFLSGARAAARLRPIVAIRPGGRLIDPSGDADAVLTAALERVGVLVVDRFDDMLAAVETLTRARPPRSETLAIVTNAIGPARMAADAALREGLALAPLTAATQAVLRLTLPRDIAGGDIAYVGADSPVRLAEVASLLAGAAEVGGILIVHAPTGPRDGEAIEAIVAASRAIRVPLLVCAMGETTGAGHRHALAEAGVAVFAGPEQAVRGFRHIVQNRRNRAAARELPPSAVLEIAPDRVAAARRLRAGDAPGMLAAYGILCAETAGAGGKSLFLRTMLDAVFGPAIVVGEIGLRRLVALPPLNLPLAHALVARLEVANEAAAADVVVRISQLLVDFPEIAELRIGALTLASDGARAADVSLRLRTPADPPSRLALPPYPAELVSHFESHGEQLTVRPIRPEDAEEHARFFRRLTPEDVRYRFFAALRELSAEQIARMTQIDYDREMAFIAVRDLTHETVGVARLVREGETSEGEFAVIVEPDAKGLGIATYLMQRLFDWAPTHGITAIVGQVLADNQPMLAFVRHLGFRIHPLAGDASVMEARLELA